MIRRVAVAAFIVFSLSSCAQSGVLRTMNDGVNANKSRANSRQVKNINDFWQYGWDVNGNPVLPLSSPNDANRTRDISIVINATDSKLIRNSGGMLTAFYSGETVHSTLDAIGVYSISRATSQDNGLTWNNRTQVIAPGCMAIAPFCGGANGNNTTNSWYFGLVASPSVIQDSNGRLYMYALGWQNSTDETSGAFGLFTSTNGFNWTDNGKLLPLDAFVDSDGKRFGEADTAVDKGEVPGEMGVPRVISLSSGGYLMTLEAQKKSTSQWRIFGAKSDSLIGPWVPLNGGSPIFIPSPGASWESVGVANPQVNETSPGNLLLAYNGRGATGWQIGFATTTVAGLLGASPQTTWTRYPTNPVIKIQPNSFYDSQVETSFLTRPDAFAPAKLFIQGYDSTGSSQVGVANPHIPQWNAVSGSALDIGSGSNNQAWMIGTDPTSGGNYHIYRWVQSTSSWQQTAGGALRIAVSPEGTPWVVDASGGIWRWNGTQFIAFPGGAYDIGVGSNESAWVIGRNPTGGGNFQIFRWHSATSSWELVPGGAVRISVSPDGTPWVVSASGSVYRWNGSAWDTLPGSASDIGVGSYGNAYIVTNQPGSGGNFEIQQWQDNLSAWQPIDGGATAISVSPEGTTWAVNATGQIFYRN